MANATCNVLANIVYDIFVALFTIDWCIFSANMSLVAHSGGMTSNVTMRVE